MPLPRIIPALADLTQDIAGPLPLALLQEWAAGTQSVEAAGDLLSTFRIEGTVVSTDTTGLSRLSEEQDLLDVLALIAAPKSILHAVGVAVGGRAIGTWVADNTEMYYPASVAAETVLTAMGEAQCRMAAAKCLGIGMAVHQGVFYEIGGGLYGRDAVAVESLAERDARGGEVLVTDRIARVIEGNGDFELTPRRDLRLHGMQAFSLEARRRMPDLTATATVFPHPYPPEFYNLLTAFSQRPDPQVARQEIYDRFLQDRVIMFLSVELDEDEGSLASLLDDLVVNALMETVLRNVPGVRDHIAGVGGGLAILAFDTPQDAFEMAMVLRARFAQNAMPVKIGIDRGPVLMFGNAHGRSGITGDAVNIASKISEDAGAVGRINITNRAAVGLADLPAHNPFQITVSGITLKGVFV